LNELPRNKKEKRKGKKKTITITKKKPKNKRLKTMVGVIWLQTIWVELFLLFFNLFIQWNNWSTSKKI
jgi:hypothetical protein